MSRINDKLKHGTRWTPIQNMKDGYRLACNHETCSLSCANIRNGSLSITSTHGEERHSYVLTDKDMAFLAIKFLDSLEKSELSSFINLFNKVSPDYLLDITEV